MNRPSPLSWPGVFGSVVRLTLGRDARELAEALAELGLSRPGALILALLASSGTATSRQMEETLSLRQPEVSTATRELRRLGWLSVESVKGDGKGRPVNHYRLRLSAPEVVERLETDRRQEIRAVEQRIAMARKLAVALRPAA